VDPEDWGMTPQTINAYYNPIRNEIVFPAAILQPPFFDMAADDAMNYGAIGAVIGHEIGHGFDDQGRRFDAKGVLRDWWTAKDGDEFMRRAKGLSAYYGAKEPIPGVKVNGDLTLGENIGDLTGLVIAHRAYQMSLGGKTAPVMDGLSGDQRFFAGWAQAWRAKIRDEALRNQVMADPHAPDQVRGNGPLPHVDAFYTAFDVKPSDNLFLAEAVRSGKRLARPGRRCRRRRWCLRPRRSQVTRCSEEPCVHDSGDTRPWARFCIMSSPMAAAARSPSSTSPACSRFF
jgi:predicted metalloendopeptidase